MPRLKRVPTLAESSGVAAGVWLMKTVLSLRSVPEGCGLEESVVEYLAALPKSLATDLAVDYMPLVPGGLDDHVRVQSVLAKVGLRTISFEKFSFWPNYSCRTEDDEDEFFSEVTPSCLKFSRTLLMPNVFSHIQKLNLSRMDALNVPDHDAILRAVAEFAKRLKYLDLANRGEFVTDTSMSAFCPKWPGDEVPCPDLEYLSVYDCHVTAGVLAEILLCHPNLAYLGYKRMAALLKLVSKSCDSDPTGRMLGYRTKLTHISNVGSKRDIPMNVQRYDLGVDNTFVKDVDRLCPNVFNLKVRVSDTTVSRLGVLMDRVKSLELCYSIGNATNIGRSTIKFFNRNGSNLSTLTILCNRLKYSQLMEIGASCPNLTQLWLKLNSLRNDLDESGMEVTGEERLLVPRQNSLNKLDQGHFEGLKVMHLQVGSYWAEESRLQRDVLSYLLKGKSNLETCIVIATKDSEVDDELVSEMVTKNWVPNLKSLNFSIPGWAQKPRVLRLTETAVINLSRLERIEEIGNLMSWTVDQGWMLGFKRHLKTANVGLRIVSR